MAEIGDMVKLKSGGPEMRIEYILQGDGTREKAAALRGYEEGDMVCSWERVMPDESIKIERETFKAATLKMADNSPID
jgi:uncharacterized protein YodC (DUF2158 family)